MEEKKGVLAVDVGGGTQDILLYQPGVEMENNVKLVLPSQTRIVGQNIRRLTEQKRNIFLHGYLMGGGASSGAVKDHLKAGLKVYATHQAALTIKDDIDRVTALGVQIVEEPPEGCHPVEFGDISLHSLEKALGEFNLELPPVFAFAVQDHGFSPHESNRNFRFSHWQEFLSSGGHLSDLIYDENSLPPYFTRMKAVLDSCGEKAQKIWLMDTGAAAIMGALEDPEVKRRAANQGCLLVNVGNQHTIAFLLSGSRVYGVFEHHTGRLTPEKLSDYLTRFRTGEISHEEVFNDHGHGCAVLQEARSFSFDFTAVTGPRRSLASHTGYLAVPRGDMMLSGAFGLAKSVRYKMGEPLFE